MKETALPRIKRTVIFTAHSKFIVKTLPGVCVMSLHSEDRKLSFLVSVSLFLAILQLVSENDGSLSLQQPL